MLKKYATVYKKMQKNRVRDVSVIAFNMWSEYRVSFFKRSVFFFFYRPLFIKLKFFKRLRRKFRKVFKRRKQSFLFFCKPNFLIHEKFKNSRMGKGKGSPLHWVYKPCLSKPCAILTGVSYYRAKAVLNFLKKHMNRFIYLRQK